MEASPIGNIHLPEALVIKADERLGYWWHKKREEIDRTRTITGIANWLYKLHRGVFMKRENIEI